MLQFRALGNEGAGNAGCRPHPRPAYRKQKQAAVTTRFSQIIRHSLRDDFTTYSALSPGGPGFLAPVAARIVPAQLGLSVGRPGPRALAVRAAFARLARLHVHRIPTLRSVTIGHNALCTEARWCEEIPAFLKHGIKYFPRRDWTLESALNRLTKFDSSRTLFCGATAVRTWLSARMLQPIRSPSYTCSSKFLVN
jgi:hypothetical protein